MDEPVKNLGWRVTFAGTGINLALGVLYAWSTLKKEIPASWGWSDFQKNLPYSICCLVFALTMVPAGRAQDRIGPRWVAMTGGLAVGAGMILASFFTTYIGFIVGFGLLAGIGIGMGYASATPPAVKWFPPQRTGLIAGLVVAGFGLASVYISPLVKFLIGAYSVARPDGSLDSGPGVQATMFILGIAFLIVVGLLSQLLAVPPAGWKPAVPASAAKSPPKAAVDYTWQEMLATPQFYLLWIMYVLAAGAGLMIIANLAPIISLQGGKELGKHAFYFVAFLAVGNASGRILAGMLSDRIGRRGTMLIVFVFQAVLMFALPQISGMEYGTAFTVFVVLAVLLGANYGANLTVFPATTKDYFGLKNFGVNYGWVFTAWGVGAVVLAQISGKVYDAVKEAQVQEMIAMGVTQADAAKSAVGNYHLAYYIAGCGLLLAAALSFMLKPPAAKAVPAEGPAATR
ncbi:MAG: OFA family MFS transporter [Planctomycetota bacterium]